jgi:hypothetical protein
LIERVSRWTVWAALTEFLLLRVLIRFGPMLPPTPVVSQAAQAVLFAGTVALNVAVILAMLAVLVVAGLTRSMVLRSLLVAVATLNVSRVTVPQSGAPVLDVIFLLYTIVALAAMMVGTTLAVAQAGQPQGQPLRFLNRLMLMLLIMIYVALAYPVALATATRLGGQWAANQPTAVSHFVAEGLAVLVALMTYFVYRPARNKLALAGALIVTALLSGFWLARPHLASSLTQWTVDFATFLPPWLYLLGLVGFLYTAIASARSSDIRSRFAAWGLTLVVLGGLRWDYTYFSGLGLLGFLLLAEPWEHHV